VYRETLGQQAHKEIQVQPVLKVLQETQVQLDRRAYQAIQAPRVLKEFREIQDLPVRKV